MFQGNDDPTSLRELLCEALTKKCPHCKKDTREKWYGWWPQGGQPLFACCKKQLVEQHGADPERVVAQNSPGLFGANPGKILASITQALVR